MKQSPYNKLNQFITKMVNEMIFVNVASTDGTGDIQGDVIKPHPKNDAFPYDDSCIIDLTLNDPENDPYYDDMDTDYDRKAYPAPRPMLYTGNANPNNRTSMGTGFFESKEAAYSWINKSLGLLPACGLKSIILSPLTSTARG